MSRKNPQTRTRILDAAWQLLEAGDNVRMSDIAKRAGISRQALYLHFPTRADLLIATTRHLDEVKNIDDRLVASRAATSGRERLALFIEAWGNYIPEIHGVARAEVPGGEPREYNTYGGNYRFDGKQLVTRVDCCSNPAYMGTDQVRGVSQEDGFMVLRPPLRTYVNRPPEQRVLYWERISEVDG